MRRSSWPLVALAWLGGCCAGDEPARQPNVLLIYTDDQRFDSLSITGNPYIKTPALDRIASEGVLFERAYVVSSRCCPGRASALTGLYPSRHGVWSNHPEVEFPGAAPTLADVFDAGGYRTAWIGKWHLPNPGAMPVRGFDHFVSYEGPGSHFDQALVVDGVEQQSQGFQADRLTDHALEFLATESTEPFMLVLAFKNPHVPMTPATRHTGQLDELTIPMPASASDRLRDLPAFYGKLRQDSRHSVEDFEDTARRYWELCLSIDDNVQRVLDHLEAAGTLDDTIVVLTTDNGQLLGEHGLSQKGLSYEPSIRVPFMMRYPAAIPAGSRSDKAALNVDLLPTLCDLAGLPAPKLQDGTSLRPLWEGDDSSWRDRFLYMAPNFGDGAVIERAVVGERWKYISIRIGADHEEVLYDLQQDPDERANQAGQQAQSLGELRGWLEAERERLGD